MAFTMFAQKIVKLQQERFIYIKMISGKLGNHIILKKDILKYIYNVRVLLWMRTRV